MLGKLIKYEFKCSGRLVPLVYLAVIILSIAGLLVSRTGQEIYTILSFSLLIMAGSAALIITYVVVFIRFYKSMYGAEGYLAMTLPVTPAQLYLSKSIVAFVWLLLSLLAFIGSFISAFAVMRYGMPEEYEKMVQAGNIQTMFSPGIIVLMILSCIVGYLSFLGLVYFCITLSNVRPFNGMGIASAVIAYICIEAVGQFVTVGLTLLVPLSIGFTLENGWYFTNVSMWETLKNMTANSTDFSIGLASFLLPLCYAFVLPFFSVKLLRTKVNLK